MGFICFRRFLVVVAVEFLMVLILRLLNSFVHLLYNQVHVLTLAHLSQNVSLELEHRFFDNAVVEIDHV